MQRIGTLLKKINELYNLNENATALEIDLMMDYTRVLYADLMEWRNRVGFNESLLQDKPQQNPIAAQPDAGVPAISYEVKSQPIELSVPTDEILDNTDEPIHGNNSTATPQYTRKDIRKYISINDKYLYTNELFGGDAIAYERSLDEINNQQSIDNAIEWLDENVNFEYSWEEEDEIVQAFYQLLSQFFASR